MVTDFQERSVSHSTSPRSGFLAVPFCVVHLFLIPWGWGLPPQLYGGTRFFSSGPWALCTSPGKHRISRVRQEPSGQKSALLLAHFWGLLLWVCFWSLKNPSISTARWCVYTSSILHFVQHVSCFDREGQEGIWTAILPESISSFFSTIALRGSNY